MECTPGEVDGRAKWQTRSEAVALHPSGNWILQVQTSLCMWATSVCGQCYLSSNLVTPSNATFSHTMLMSGSSLHLSCAVQSHMLRSTRRVRTKVMIEKL